MSSQPDAQAVDTYLKQLQDTICSALEREDGKAQFLRDELEGPGGSLSRPRVLEGGPVFDKAAVNFTHARGPALPPAASETRPHVAGLLGSRSPVLDRTVESRSSFSPVKGSA